jgi:hypothetical protein
MRFHFLRDCVNNTKFVVLHVSTYNMLADILTKSFFQILLEKHRNFLGVC